MWHTVCSWKKKETVNMILDWFCQHKLNVDVEHESEENAFE